MMPWTPPFHGRARNVDLPVVVHAAKLPNALREDVLEVVVARDGQVFFGRVHISPDELPQKIHEGLKGGAEKRIYLRADARAKYADVKKVLDQIRISGVENVSLVMEQASR